MTKSMTKDLLFNRLRNLKKDIMNLQTRLSKSDSLTEQVEILQLISFQVNEYFVLHELLVEEGFIHNV